MPDQQTGLTKRLRARTRGGSVRTQCAEWHISEPDLDCLDAADEIDRLTLALDKIAKRWPCSTADDMARVAAEAIGGTPLPAGHNSVAEPARPAMPDSGSDQGKQEGTAGDPDSQGRHGPHKFTAGER